MDGATIPESPGSVVKPGILLALTAIAVILTIVCLLNGITIVFTHFYYIPIILAAYWYDRRGIFYTVCLSGFYLVSVYLLSQPDMAESISSIVRVMVFIGISIFAAYLSLVIRRDRENLQRSETKFRKIWENIEAGIILVDSNTHLVVDANPVAERLTGYSREEMTGHICHKFICPAEMGKCPVTDGGQTIDHTERTLLGRDGKTIPIIKTVTPMTIDDNKYLVENFVDISAVKDAENALIAYIREAALRVTNPLQIVRQNISEIKTQVKREETGKEHILTELAVQEKHLDEILETLKELNVAIAEKRREIPDSIKEFLKR